LAILGQGFCQLNGSLNILRLRALVSASQKDDQGGSLLQVVDPVSRAKVDPQLRNASSDGFGIARIAADEALKPG
jgi:hypothetical protein